jgi:hypothetical protein
MTIATGEDAFIVLLNGDRSSVSNLETQQNPLSKTGLTTLMLYCRIK